MLKRPERAAEEGSSFSRGVRESGMRTKLPQPHLREADAGAPRSQELFLRMNRRVCGPSKRAKLQGAASKSISSGRKKL